MSGCNCNAIKLKKSLVAKCARGFVVFMSIFGLVFYVSECYKKLKVTPQVLVNEKIVNSWEVPFPAVTICAPLIAKSDVLNITKCRLQLGSGKSLDEDDFEKLASYLHVCPDPTFLSSLSNKYVETDKVLGDILNNISLKIADVLNACIVDNFAGCEQIYIRSLTDSGYCFSFNMLGYHSLFNDGVVKDFDVYKRTKIRKSFDSNDAPEVYDDEKHPELTSWTPEQGYPTENSLQPLPAIKGRALVTSLKYNKVDATNFCLTTSNLYFVFLHLPNELPTLMHQNFFYRPNTNNVLKVSAEIKQNDKTLMNFDIKERGCFFEDEMNLKFFKSYTKLNCEYECLINFTQQQCGCVRLTMPRTNDMNVCKIKDIQCYRKIAESWPSIYFRTSERHEKFPSFLCGCLPLCTQIKYTILDKISVVGYHPNDGVEYSTIAVKFDDSQINKRTNYVTYKLQDFIADIGGLIGLFLGLSLLSMFELLLKLCYYLKRNINVWFRRLKRESEEASIDAIDDTLTEVITVQEFRCLDSNEINQNDSIFIIPGHVDSPLEIEDLEDY